MEQNDLNHLLEMRAQMLRLRNDDGLVTGVTFNTLAGDIVISRKETALMLIDTLISDIQKQISYQMKE